MVIEWLKIKVASELREKFIAKDAQVWTAMLSGYPGFLSKEVWINPEIPTEVVLIIHWQTLEQWKSIPADKLVETDQLFTKEFGEPQEIIEAAQYQVRKFPQI
ncbi:MAG: TIGR03792 family protein [Coleofasciculaceae cyanobacterium]